MAAVDSNTPPTRATPRPSCPAPRPALVFGPFAKTEFYVNAGLGYHSNDARGATITVNPSRSDAAAAAVPLLVRSQRRGDRRAHAGHQRPRIVAGAVRARFRLRARCSSAMPAHRAQPAEPAHRRRMDQPLSADAVGDASMSTSPTPGALHRLFLRRRLDPGLAGLRRLGRHHARRGDRLVRRACAGAISDRGR